MIFTAIMFSDRLPHKLPIGVIMQDDSRFARELLFSLKNSPQLEVAKICTQEYECESALKSQKVLGVVHLPQNLERRAVRGENFVIGLYLNGQSLIAYNMVELAVLGIIASRSSPSPIKVESHAINNASLDYRAYLGIGIVAATFHLAAMIIAAYVLGNSWTNRMATLSFLIIFLQHGIYTYIFHSWANIYFSLWQWGLLFLASFFMLAAAFGFCATAFAITKSMRIATSAGGVIGGPAFAFSGLAFPIFAMPFAVQIFAWLLPLTHFLKVQNALRMETIALPFIRDELIVLFGFAVFWCGLAAIIGKKR